MKALALVSCFFALIGCAYEKSAEQCDPRRVGFWENLGCQQHWQSRIELREKELDRLYAKHDRLITENADLTKKIAVSRETISFLEKELEPSRRRLHALSKVKLTQENYNQHFHALSKELAFLVKGLDAATQARLGCSTKEYERVIAHTRPLTSFGQESLEWVASIYGSKKLGDEIEKVAPKFISNAYDLLSGIATVVDTFNRLDRLTRTVTEYETRTEIITTCQ
ncbi:MAG: hypothetical protein AAF936_08915 [Pseudomonadota bacterium]